MLIIKPEIIIILAFRLTPFQSKENLSNNNQSNIVKLYSWWRSEYQLSIMTRMWLQMLHTDFRYQANLNNHGREYFINMKTLIQFHKKNQIKYFQYFLCLSMVNITRLKLFWLLIFLFVAYFPTFGMDFTETQSNKINICFTKYAIKNYSDARKIRIFF